MSVRDFDRIIDLKNMTTGENFARIDYDDFDDYYSHLYISCTIGEARLLKAIDDCIDNNHNCLISIGYKNK